MDKYYGYSKIVWSCPDGRKGQSSKPIPTSEAKVAANYKNHCGDGCTYSVVDWTDEPEAAETKDKE